jgi:hypothetical protein
VSNAHATWKPVLKNIAVAGHQCGLGVLRRAENRIQIDRTGGVRLLKEHAARAKRRKADSRCKNFR